MRIDHIYDTSSIDNATAYKIQRTARLLRYSLNRFFQQLDLVISQEQWFILFRLYEKQGQSQRELADKDLNDHPNITRLIDALVRQGYVRREADPRDRRRSLIYLTAEGETLMESLKPKIIETRRQVFAGVSAEEIEVLGQILQKIEVNMMKMI